MRSRIEKRLRRKRQRAEELDQATAKRVATPLWDNKPCTVSPNRSLAEQVKFRKE